MKRLTTKQSTAIATTAAIITGSLTPFAVRHFSPVPDSVDPFYAGHPVTTNEYVVLTNRTYVVAYDYDTKNPAWVAYKLHWPESFVAPKRPSSFRKDKRLNPALVHADYTDTGFDRGHMAPNYGIAVCYGKGGQRETFLMSNVIPQTPGLNRGPWRILEEKVAKSWTVDSDVWVITGPIYDDEREDPRFHFECGATHSVCSKGSLEAHEFIRGSSHEQQLQTLPGGIRVPGSCFKVLVRQASTNEPPQAMAFVIPQRVLMKDSFTNFVSSVDRIEELTGFDFFAELPDAVERIMEAEKTIW